MDKQELFDNPVIPPPPEDHDEVVKRVTVIDALPGGIGQTAQPLAEPIEILHFVSVKVKDSLDKPSIVPIKLITAEQGMELVKADQFSRAMVPQKSQCKSCDAELPADRSLHCHTCRPSLGEDPGGFLYCGVSGE